MLSYTTLILATIAQLATGVVASPTATPLRRALAGSGYATFYNDNACTQGAGQAVSMGNDGCLANEYGRKSIYIQPGASDTGFGRTKSLVWSPGNSCNCQNDCAPVSYNGGNNYCWNLNGHKEATSFRFIAQGCGGNNC